MSEQALSLPLDRTAAAEERRRSTSTLVRIVRYTFLRSVALFATVVVGVYLTILIANMGGYVDEIRRAEIRNEAAISIGLNPRYRNLTAEERNRLIEQTIALQEDRLGLNKPFVQRSFTYLVDAMTLSLGFAERLVSDSGSRQVRNIILERLPSTLVLFATANFLLFFLGLFFALGLSRSYGSVWDKINLALAPTSAAPAWFYGLFLILIFAALFHVLPYGGMVSAPPPEDPVQYGLSLARHLILPVGAFLLATVFLFIYQWRTFFLIYSSEDYVDMAKAKGLPDKLIERRYVLRPTLPTIVTSFALTLITLWAGSITLETVFNWPGLGRLLFQAIGLYDTPVIMASTVIYAYLLAVTVFLLDFVYALVDPRVRVGDSGKKA